MGRTAWADAKGEADRADAGRSRRRLASLLISSTILGSAGLFAPVVAHAQQQPAAQTVGFNIPAQPLRSAINAFTRATGWEVGFTSQAVAGKRSSAVSGTLPPDQALRALLAGTGLSASISGPSTAAIVEPAAANGGAVAADGSLVLDTINVQGENPFSTLAPMAPYAGGQVATGGQVGMLGNRNVMDTPFSQTSYTNKTIQDQQARTVQDVLANDASVVMTASGALSEFENDTIRGFRTRAAALPRSLNGLPGIAPRFSPSTDFIERVEVFKGPSALINGMTVASAANVGGTINLITKQAGDEPLTRLTTRYSSRSQLGAHVDIGRRFGANKEFGIRFNGSFDKGGMRFSPQESELGTAALNLDYRGERVRLSADVLHMSDVSDYEGRSSLYIGNGLSVPKAPDNGKGLFPWYAGYSQKATVGVVRGEFDITDNVTAFAAIGAQKFDIPRSTGSVLQLLDNNGRYTYMPYTKARRDEVLSLQGGLRAKVDTGPINHTLNLNLSQSSWHAWSTPYVPGPTIVASSIYNPIYLQPSALPDPGRMGKSNNTQTSSVGIADTLSLFDERIQFTAGIRYQKIDAKSYNNTSNLISSHYNSDAWTPALGFVVKPSENVSLYASYIEGLQPGTTVGSTYANAGETFAPYVSKQYEAGVKVDWGTVTTTLAAFQIAQPSTYSIPSAGGGLPTLALAGEQRNRGVELSAYGEIFDGVRLLAGVTYLDGRQTKTLNGALDGKRAENAPTIRAVIGGEWDTPFIKGLTLSGRLTYTSDQVVINSRPNLKIPSWAQLDLGMRYTFESPWNAKPVTIRFNVDNVFDKNYWATVENGYVYPGVPRTYRLSTTFNF